MAVARLRQRAPLPGLGPGDGFGGDVGTGGEARGSRDCRRLGSRLTNDSCCAPASQSGDV